MSSDDYFSIPLGETSTGRLDKMISVLHDEFARRKAETDEPTEIIDIMRERGKLTYAAPEIVNGMVVLTGSHQEKARGGHICAFWTIQVPGEVEFWSWNDACSGHLASDYVKVGKSANSITVLAPIEGMHMSRHEMTWIPMQDGGRHQRDSHRCYVIDQGYPVIDKTRESAKLPAPHGDQASEMRY